MWNPRTCNCKCNEACKIDKYLHIKNYSYRKRLFGKEDEVLNTTEISLVDKK